MKKTLLISTVLATLLLSSTALFAGSKLDEVSPREHQEAKAKVEESRMRTKFMSEMDTKKFTKEAKQDKSKELKKR